MTVEISIAVGFRIKESLEISDLSHYLLDNPLGTRFLYQFLEYVPPRDHVIKIYFSWISIVLSHLEDSDIPTQNQMEDCMKD